MGHLADPITRSNLRELSPARVASLTAGARRVCVPAGTMYRREGEDGAHLELVVSGLVRIFVTAPDGRTLTIRYARPGAIMGVVSLYAPDFSMPGSIQALVDSDLLVLRPETVRHLAATDLAVAGALLDELGERVLAFVKEIPGSAFASVRERVARHLLDLASERQHGRVLVAAVTQQQLAEGVGSVREVVVRILRELREEGAIRTTSHGIVILDPDCLFEAAGPRIWNTGSRRRALPAARSIRTVEERRPVGDSSWTPETSST